MHFITSHLDAFISMIILFLVVAWVVALVFLVLLYKILSLHEDLYDEDQRKYKKELEGWFRFLTFGIFKKIPR